MSEIDWSKAPHWADRVIEGGASNLLYWASDNMLQPVIEGGVSFVTHTHIRNGLPVVERRPVPQTINIRPPQKLMYRCVAAPVSRTIEQSITSLRALEKQVEETRAELTRDLEPLGLTWMVRDEPIDIETTPDITDWRDLRVGDVVEYCVGELGTFTGEQGKICNIDTSDDTNRIEVEFNNGDRYWCTSCRFTRRP